ncbi:MAG: HAD-IIIC family phosphatase [Bryobacteraceae bacterium]|nr:HAD-IIIC family phosphatase [Bryobacteraceae bacterium]
MGSTDRPSAESFVFSIAASFTAEPLQASLLFWGRQLQSSFEIRFAPFNQLMQTLLDSGSVFAQNRHGVNVLLVRFEDLGAFSADDAEALAQAIRQAPEHARVPLIVGLCPASPEAPPNPAARDRFFAQVREIPGVQIIDENEVQRLYPVENWYDASGDELGKIPFTELYFAALGTAIVRHAHALHNPPYKAVAVDCDNTLWLGVCGEDGAEGVKLNASRRALHEFLLAQREAGMLLCLNSKNNEADVWETFAAHPEFPLQPQHFAAWRVNWESKAANISSLAEELNFGADSFIFLDDNARETAEVTGSLPEVLSLTLPEESSAIPAWLNHLWAFDHPVVTAEDRRRSASYVQSLEFGRRLHSASNLEEFVASLGLRVDVSPLAPERFSRAAQLTQRTNQFNCTTIRRGEAELHALLQTGRHEIFTAEVSDRFGDYGLTGLLILEKLDDEYRVDTFLLSCRVLGRGVEHRLLAFLGEHAEEDGIHRVTVPFTPSRKNRPAHDFLESIPDGVRTVTPSGCDYAFEAMAIQGMRWKPARKSEVGEPKPAQAEPAQRGFYEFDRIARELQTPEEVLEAMRREARATLQPVTGDGAPQSDVERRLSAVWAEILQRSQISVHDNFFDLGGHSLLAVLLLMRVKEEFGVELSVDDVYSGTLTLRELAQTIEARQMGDVAPEEYQALLAEIEGLSDEEVHALLAAEEQAEDGPRE